MPEELRHVNNGAAGNPIGAVINRHRGIHEIAIGVQMADTQFGKLAGPSADRILMALGASPGVVDGAQSHAGIMGCFVDLLVESEGVAGGFVMPLLLLWEPGFCASVGVSKPAGASVGES